MNPREFLKEKKRIVIKIGSSSLVHKETGELDFLRIEKLIRMARGAVILQVQPELSCERYRQIEEIQSIKTETEPDDDVRKEVNA